jgi:hypothetical protein
LAPDGFGGALGGGGGLCDGVGAVGATAGGANEAALDSVTARTSIKCPHFRHFIRTVLPATFSSAIWYFALHCSQRNFTASQVGSR